MKDKTLKRLLTASLILNFLLATFCVFTYLRNLARDETFIMRNRPIIENFYREHHISIPKDPKTIEELTDRMRNTEGLE
jgi:hypothetical protein